jgi:hypothetical protein
VSRLANSGYLPDLFLLAVHGFALGHQRPLLFVQCFALGRQRSCKILLHAIQAVFEYTFQFGHGFYFPLTINQSV